MPEFAPESTPQTDHAGAAPSRTAVLFETGRGQVRRCACCDRLELRFGNALMALAPDDLTTVLAQVGGADGPARETTLFLSDSGCGWVFSAGELAELHRLVAGARLLLDLA